MARPLSGKGTRQGREERVVFADVILRSASGRPVPRGFGEITPDNVHEFLPDRKTLEAAGARLRELGFNLNLVAETHITISGPRELFERVFGVELVEKFTTILSTPKRGPRLQPGEEPVQPYYEPTSEPKIPETLAPWVQSIHFPLPPTYHITPTPPALSYDHIQVPLDVARGMDALKAHARGITGAGVRLAMVDSGFMTPFHPYYTGKGYNIQPVNADPMDPDPNGDAYGHGTGIAACALAVAPGVTFIPVKTYGGAAASFARAVALKPHIITNSWGLCVFCSPFVDPTLQLAINNAIASGIVVLFSTGNGGPVGWPGGEPAVISVGGTFLGPDDTIQGSTYASSGTFNGRQAPDVCGIVGQAPKGILIALPTQPSSTVDGLFGGGTFPDGDQTPSDDGWVVASGTSSSCPMVAGVAALLMQVNPALVGDPGAVRLALNDSCIDVAAGNSASGEPAGPGEDLATGFGLVQAYRAVNPTDVWIKDNTDSDVGWIPIHGRRPKWPPYAHWTSADIKVLAAPLANPAAQFSATPAVQPIFGQDNYVYVRVRNRGRQAAGPVSVRLYYGDPSTNLLFPADWNDGQSGVPSQGSLKVGAASTNLQTVASVAAGSVKVLPDAFVWRPPDPTIATQTQVLPDGRTQGHFCLLVRVETADDPIILTAGTQTSVIGDNNIGMKNEWVLSGPATMMFSLNFFVSGLPREEQERTDLLLDTSRLPRGSRAVLEIDDRYLEDARLVEARRSARGILLKRGKKPAGIAHLNLRPDEKALATISIQFPADTVPRAYPVAIVQTSKGLAVGGATFIPEVV